MNAARCFTGTHVTVRFTKETFVTNGSRVKRVLTWAMSKWTKHVVTFNEEEDEDILEEDGLQIERDTVFLRDACHREIYQRNFLDKRLPREACFDLGDVKVEKDIVTFNEEEDEDPLVEGRPQIERATVSLRNTCYREIHPRNMLISDSRVKRDLIGAMSKWIKRF